MQNKSAIVKESIEYYICGGSIDNLSKTDLLLSVPSSTNDSYGHDKQLSFWTKLFYTDRHHHIKRMVGTVGTNVVNYQVWSCIQLQREWTTPFVKSYMHDYVIINSCLL